MVIKMHLLRIQLLLMGVIFTKPSCAWAQRDSSCGIVFKLAPAGADYASLGLANNIHGNGIRMSKKCQP